MTGGIDVPLAKALKALGVSVEEKQGTAERLDALVAVAIASREERLSVQSDLQRTLKDLGITLEENKSLKEYVAELSQAAKESKLEAEVVKEQLAALKQGMSAKDSDTNMLTERVASLHAECEECRAINEELADELDAARQQVAAAASSGATTTAALKAQMHLAIEKLESEAAQLRRDNAEHREDLITCQATLTDALSEVDTLFGDKRGLKEQVNALVSKYKTARATLRYLMTELQRSIDVMESALKAKDAVDVKLERVTGEAEVRVQRVQHDARQERAVLVSAALKSLEILRAHVAASSSGLMLGTTQPASQPPNLSTAQLQAMPPPQPPPSAHASLPPTAGYHGGAIDGSEEPRRQWQPKGELSGSSGITFKSKHRWGVPPEPHAILTSMWHEANAQAAGPIRGPRSLTATPRGTHHSYHPDYHPDGYSPTAQALIRCVV